MLFGLFLETMNITAIISDCHTGEKTNGAGIVIAVIFASQGLSSAQLKGNGLRGQLKKSLKPGEATTTYSRFQGSQYSMWRMTHFMSYITTVSSATSMVPVCTCCFMKGQVDKGCQLRRDLQ
jgi:hypothetical protein